MSERSDWECEWYEVYLLFEQYYDEGVQTPHTEKDTWKTSQPLFLFSLSRYPALSLNPFTLANPSGALASSVKNCSCSFALVFKLALMLNKSLCRGPHSTHSRSPSRSPSGTQFWQNECMQRKWTDGSSSSPLHEQIGTNR